MELKEATYKTTELGLIPEDWTVESIEDLTIKVGSGITPKGGANVYRLDGRPFVRSQNIGWGDLRVDDLVFISDEIHNTFPNTEIKIDDVFLNISGASIGRSSVASHQLEGGNVNQHVCIIRVAEDRIVPKFLNSFLLSKVGQKQIDSFQSGGNREGLNIGQIKTFKIPVPPPAEQKAIATALSDVDKLITNLSKLITKKKAIKQGAMQRLLKSPAQGGQRLPGFEGEWVENKLLRLLKEKPGYGINAPAVEFNLDLPCYLRITDISDSGEYIDSNKVSVKHPDSANFILNEGELVLARTGASVGKSYLYNPNDGFLVYAGFLIKVSPDPTKLNPVYLKFYLQSKQYWDWVSVMSMRSGQPGINGNEYGTLTLSLPPTMDEQNKIASILSDMDAEIESLETQKSKYLHIKQGMMQELLTGKTRLV